MALVPCGIQTDSMGRKAQCYIDTDDLEQKEYYYYCKAKELVGKVQSASFTAMMILKGRLTAEQIEKNPKYNWLTDDLVNLVVSSK